MQQCENNTVLDTVSSDIVWDHRIKTRDDWEAEVEVICEKISNRAHALKEELITHSKQVGVLMAKLFKNVNALHNELEHLLEDIEQAAGKSM